MQSRASKAFYRTIVCNSLATDSGGGGGYFFPFQVLFLWGQLLIFVLDLLSNRNF